MNTTDWEAEFEERYFDKGTPSGLNQHDFGSFPELVKDIPSFIREVEKRAEERGRNEAVEHDNRVRGDLKQP